MTIKKSRHDTAVMRVNRWFGGATSWLLVALIVPAGLLALGLVQCIAWTLVHEATGFGIDRRGLLPGSGGSVSYSWFGWCSILGWFQTLKVLCIPLVAYGFLYAVARVEDWRCGGDGDAD